jgi:hypothetical protein
LGIVAGVIFRPKITKPVREAVRIDAFFAGGGLRSPIAMGSRGEIGQSTQAHGT